MRFTQSRKIGKTNSLKSLGARQKPPDKKPPNNDEKSNVFFLYIFFILIVILDILKYKGKKINTCRKNFLHILFIIINIYIY